MLSVQRIDRDPGQGGFTLVEIILTLVVLGIVAALGLNLMTMATEGYIFSRENVSGVQRAQLALARISRELIGIIDVTAASGTSITFTNTSGVHTIRLVSGEVQLQNVSEDPANYYELADEISIPAGSDFLTYSKADGTAWTTADDVDELFAVNVLLVISRVSGSETMTFQATVNPRNNGNLNAPT